MIKMEIVRVSTRPFDNKYFIETLTNGKMIYVMCNKFGMFHVFSLDKVKSMSLEKDIVINGKDFMEFEIR